MLREAIELLISLEVSIEEKCDLLTAIGITSTNKEVFTACEEIRNNLPESKTIETEQIRAEIIRNPVDGVLCDDMPEQERSNEVIE